MECTFALVADAANVEASGKMNVLGIFDKVQSETFPYLHPQMFVVVTLVASPSEYGKKKDFEICLVDPDGRALTTLAAKGDVPKPDAGTKANMQIMIGLANSPFPKPGPYSIDILVGGDRKASIPVEAVQLRSLRATRKKGPKKNGG